MGLLRPLTFIFGKKEGVGEELSTFLESIPHSQTLQLEIPDFQGEMQYVSETKAQWVAQIVNGPVLVECNGLCFNALNGLPGSNTNFSLQKIGLKGVYKLLEPYEDKSADALSVLSLSLGRNKKPLTFVGKTPGKIVPTAQELGDSGWDPIFQPDGHDKTYAEMSKDEKSMISHSSRAFELIKAHFDVAGYNFDGALTLRFHRDITTGYMRFVKDQGNCPMCWAISVSDATSIMIAIKTGKPYQQLSASELLDCTHPHEKKSIECYPYNAMAALHYISTNGAIPEAIYPFVAEKKICQDRSDDLIKAKVFIKDYEVIDEHDEDAIMRAVREYPIIASIYVMPGFKNLGPNIYAPRPPADWRNPTNPNAPVRLHSIVVVSWGFHRVSKKFYWIFRNSGGTNWGVEGFGKIAFNSCMEPGQVSIVNTMRPII